MNFIMHLIGNISAMVISTLHRIVYYFGEFQPLFDRYADINFRHSMPKASKIEKLTDVLVVLDDMMVEVGDRVTNVSVMFMVQNFFNRNKHMRTISLMHSTSCCSKIHATMVSLHTSRNDCTHTTVATHRMHTRTQRENLMAVCCSTFEANRMTIWDWERIFSLANIRSCTCQNTEESVQTCLLIWCFVEKCVSSSKQSNWKKRTHWNEPADATIPNDTKEDHADKGKHATLLTERLWQAPDRVLHWLCPKRLLKPVQASEEDACIGKQAHVTERKASHHLAARWISHLTRRTRDIAFSALTLLVGHQEEHLARKKNWVMG